MRKGFKVTAVMAGLLLMAAGSSGVYANCTASIMPVFQCGFVGFFAPPPAGAGTVSAIWWQLGYGNNNINNGATTSAAAEGTGHAPTGTFSGNDSGIGMVYLTDADSVLTQYSEHIPDGSLCSNFENSWAASGIDGCSDNPRSTNAYDNDNALNPYWGPYYSYCPYAGYPAGCDSFYNRAYQIDYPMAFLVRESTNRFFALAMVASKQRAGMGVDKAADISENFYDLATVSNGMQNPIPDFSSRNNFIPWQQVPRPRVDSVVINTDMTRTVSLSWTNITIHHDNSNRPTDNALRTARGLGTVQVVNGGVGVLNQGNQAGGLCRYQLQSAPVTSASPDPSTLTWTNVGGPILCSSAAPGSNITFNHTVPPDTALRVRTILGKQPRTTNTLLAQVRAGASGDLAFEATDCRANNCLNSPPLMIVGGGLVSEQAIETVAARNKNAVTVSFRTTSELTVSNIDILGKGDAVLKTVPCKQCTTGIGDEYSLVLTTGELKGSKELKVRLNGPGATSGAFPIQ
ncbi:MAG TPA: hypothetical protein VJV23_00010 [Candidatus Polarisedimenticolia bacterium]|nr:hypothetical protein [Candidatus Polarisedimenticolia bacterium]